MLGPENLFAEYDVVHFIHFVDPSHDTPSDAHAKGIIFKCFNCQWYYEIPRLKGI